MNKRHSEKLKRDLIVFHTSKAKEIIDIIEAEDEIETPEELDKAAFEMFKLKVSENPRIIVK